MLLCAASLLPPALAAQSLDSATAGLRDARVACARDGGRLWGASLCGPVVLVRPSTRVALANRRDPDSTFAARDGAWVGTLPSSVGVANTSVRWGDAYWSMVMLPLPADRFERIKLLAHESYHRLQSAQGRAGADPVNAHLDERDGRLWLRMELRALAAALRATGPLARQRTEDALTFSAYRRQLYPGSDTLEAALEMQEGLAEYTGARLALDVTGAREDRVARQLAELETRPSYVRSFAYATGPALGLLLDRYAPGWRGRVREERDMTRLLADALHFTPPPDLAVAAPTRAMLYGFVKVAAAEDARDADRRARAAAYRAALVDGPVLVARQKGLGTVFDPNTLVPLGAEGTVYPTGTFTAPWGKLQVTEGGALVSPDFTTVRVPAPADTAARPLRGRGWTLELAPGWTVRPAVTRPGDWELAPPEPQQ